MARRYFLVGLWKELHRSIIEREGGDNSLFLRADLARQSFNMMMQKTF